MTRRGGTTADVVIAVGLGAAAAAAGLRRYRGAVQMPVAAASFASWIALGGPVAVVAAGVGRRRGPAAVGIALSAMAVRERLHLLPTTHTTTDAGALTVMQANLWLGRADPAAVVETAGAHEVDLLCVQEITADCRDALVRAGIDDLFPHRIVVAAPEGAGTGLWSRHPLSDARDVPGFTLAAVAARVSLPTGGSVTVLSVHPMPPYPYEPRLWLGELRRIRDAVDRLDGPVVVGGDLNATDDHAAFRDLLGDDLVDAGAGSRSGPLPTYPAHKRWIPPLIGIDHVLLRGVRAERVVTVRLPGSDHRGLVATVRVD